MENVITMEAPEYPCTQCGGSGNCHACANPGNGKCSTCAGTGYHPYPELCNRCGGTTNCKLCGGDGHCIYGPH